MISIACLTAFDALFTIADILRGSFALSIPLFLIAIAGSAAHKKISKRFKFSWFVSSLAVAFFFCFAFSLFAYYFPLFQAFSEENLGIEPPEMQDTPIEMAGFALFSLLKVAIFAALITALAVPFAVLGGLVKDKLKEKKYNEYLCLFAGVFSMSLLASFLLLFFFGWVLQGLVFLLYFSG